MEDLLDPVSKRIRQLYPNCQFMVAVWQPGEKATMVNMHTNCELKDVAGVLKRAAAEMEDVSEVGKIPHEGSA
jgi:hypothetical protein